MHTAYIAISRNLDKELHVPLSSAMKVISMMFSFISF